MNRVLALLQSHRPLIMGILNVTPDSFSDGGLHFHPDAALAQARRMLAEGADIIDVGGESTRPGSEPVPAAEQIARVAPVVAALRAALPDCAVSVDTTRAAVAEAALDAGADMVNDVAAGRDDDGMFELAARRGVPYCLMHMQGDPKTMQEAPHYEAVVDEVLAFLLERAARAEQAGVAREHLVIDPGIGFGKRRQDNLELLAALDRFAASGYPVLLGTSRKRFMGAICQVETPAELVPATVATTALGVMAGARIFRVHDVKENRQAADIAWAVRLAGRG
ncbi:dihydropteroate synthase [Methylogaea oryzae]|nr:dihydropteroate synthase [Methylogaea oryzae]